VVPNLVSWLGVEGDSYDQIMQRYMQVLAQWNRFITRVTSAVGGLEEHLKVVGEEGPVYTPIPAAEQRRSLLWLTEHVYETPEWLLDRELLRRFEHVGAVERIRWYQVNGLERLLEPARLERMIEQQAFLGAEAYSVARMLDDLRGALWRELAEGVPIDMYRRNLQRGYLDRMAWLLTEASASAPAPPEDYRPDLETPGFDDVTLRTPFHVHQSDVVPLVREQLELLRDEIRARADAASRAATGGGGGSVGLDRETRAHLREALRRIEGLL
jgi:hypothetical protein